jgi:hypothetical protein
MVVLPTRDEMVKSLLRVDPNAPPPEDAPVP